MKQAGELTPFVFAGFSGYALQFRLHGVFITVHESCVLAMLLLS